MGRARRPDGGYGPPYARMPLSVAAALRTPGLDPVDARVLLQHVLGVEHAWLIAHADVALAAEQRTRYLELAERRRCGEPVAYLTGWREFYGRRFRVDRSVLIPRPETELLVDLALERIPPAANCTILDLGAGSGCVAVTLALERPQAEVVAVEMSPPAAAIARANAHDLGAHNLRLLQGDWFDPVRAQTFDLVASNPPYVADTDPHLKQGDVRFEPRSALAAGADGLDCIRKIIAEAQAHLRPDGWLLFEHGYDQGEACIGLLEGMGYVEAFDARDLAELPRVCGGRKAPGLT